MNKQNLIQEIKTAFKGVTLEDGIGLLEGNGLDDWLDGDDLIPLRQQDERENWENISFEDICNYESAFSYIDAKGMRFLMPQYMIADILEKRLCFEPLWKLENVENGTFNLFNTEQIQAVIHYLEYKNEEDLKYTFEQNKLCGVDDEFNQLLYEEDLENFQNSPIMKKWKQMFEDRNK